MTLERRSLDPTSADRGRGARTTAATDPLWRALLVPSCVLVILIGSATPAYAAGDIAGVIDSIRNWITGLLAALATLFLMIGGVRYLLANGNPRAAEEGKAAIRSALIGYAIAAMAPMFVDVMKRVLGF
jgi:type IV secretion system pilin